MHKYHSHLYCFTHSFLLLAHMLLPSIHYPMFKSGAMLGAVNVSRSLKHEEGTSYSELVSPLFFFFQVELRPEKWGETSQNLQLLAMLWSVKPASLHQCVQTRWCQFCVCAVDVAWSIVLPVCESHKHTHAHTERPERQDGAYTSA